MNKPFRDRLRLHLRSQVDGELAIQQITLLTRYLATGFEERFNIEVPLDELRTKQVVAALGSYHRTLTRVMPDLKSMDLMEALAPAAEGRDWSQMDRLELANRLRHLFKNAFKQGALEAPLTDEEFMR